MENKYKTPCVDELHVGLKLEKLNNYKTVEDVFRCNELRMFFDIIEEPKEFWDNHELTEAELCFYKLNKNWIKKDLRIKIN